MNRYALIQFMRCLAGFFIFIPLASGQGSIGGINAQLNQMEAIESHLQQSRTQASRETEDVAKKNAAVHESGKPAISTQAVKRPAGNREKIKSPAAGSIKND